VTEATTSKRAEQPSASREMYVIPTPLSRVRVLIGAFSALTHSGKTGHGRHAIPAPDRSSRVAVQQAQPQHQAVLHQQQQPHPAEPSKLPPEPAENQARPLLPRERGYQAEPGSLPPEEKQQPQQQQQPHTAMQPAQRSSSRDGCTPPPPRTDASYFSSPLQHGFPDLRALVEWTREVQVVCRSAADPEQPAQQWPNGAENPGEQCTLPVPHHGPKGLPPEPAAGTLAVPAAVQQAQQHQAEHASGEPGRALHAPGTASWPVKRSDRSARVPSQAQQATTGARWRAGSAVGTPVAGVPSRARPPTTGSRRISSASSSVHSRSIAGDRGDHQRMRRAAIS
jgi:hypothetical protein